MEQADLPNEGTVFFFWSTWTWHLDEKSGWNQPFFSDGDCDGFLWSLKSFRVMVFHGSTQQTLTKRVDGSCRVYICFKPKNAFWTNNIGTGTTSMILLRFLFENGTNVGAVNLPNTLKGAPQQRVPSGFIQNCTQLGSPTYNWVKGKNFPPKLKTVCPWKSMVGSDDSFQNWKWSLWGWGDEFVHFFWGGEG